MQQIRRLCSAFLTSRYGSRAPLPVKVVVEIPDVLDSTVADTKFTVRIQEMLQRTDGGTLVSVDQGEAMTPREYSRFITIELTDDDVTFGRLLDLLDQIGAPTGTFVASYQEDGEKCDLFVFGGD